MFSLMLIMAWSMFPRQFCISAMIWTTERNGKISLTRSTACSMGMGGARGCYLWNLICILGILSQRGHHLPLGAAASPLGLLLWLFYYLWLWNSALHIGQFLLPLSISCTMQNQWNAWPHGNFLAFSKFSLHIAHSSASAFSTMG